MKIKNKKRNRGKEKKKRKSFFKPKIAESVVLGDIFKFIFMTQIMHTFKSINNVKPKSILRNLMELNCKAIFFRIFF